MASIPRATIALLLVLCSQGLQWRDDPGSGDCWKPCGNSGGLCKFCGPDKVCCRQNFASDPPECEGSKPSQNRFHECVEPADDGPSSEEVARFANSLVANRDPVGERPSLAAFVFSRVVDHERRAQIRDMWVRATQLESIKAGYKFAVCGGAGNSINSDGTVSSLVLRNGDTSDQGLQADESTRAALDKELRDFGDVVYLDCTEGYGQGALTRKAIASMQYFWQHMKADYFMKIDDDTFISWSKYVPELSSRGHRYVYMGIQIGEGVPCRNETFRWYEPWSTYKKALFPKAMSGGSGYTVGSTLVNMVLNARIAETHVLYNEDRAVGVWMDKVQRAGIKVDHENLVGIDGFWAWDWSHPTQNWETWGSYPYILHHGLEGKTIACLAAADAENGPTKHIDNCFTHEEGKTHEPLKCAALNTEANDMKSRHEHS